MKHSILLPVAAAILFSSCISTTTVRPAPAAPAVAPAAPPARSTHELLDSTLWVQTAAEYQALAMQSYGTATRMLDAALADPSWTAALEQEGQFSNLPPAIALDIDETVLDNSAFEARLLVQNRPYDEKIWARWADEGIAPPIPGAVEFTNYARDKGVTVFFITNRNARNEAITRENLRKTGFPLRDDADTVLMSGEREEWTSDKSSRRKFISRNYRVLLLVGDDLGDFLSGVRISVPERAALARKYAANWGTKWIVVPNPMYGSWESALTGYKRGLSDADVLRAKYDALRTQEGK